MMNCVKNSIQRDLYEDIKSIANQHIFKEVQGKAFLITGGNGFVAYYIALVLMCVNDLTSNGNQIILLVRNKERAEEKYGFLAKREDLSFLVQDICEPISAPEQGFDYIIHAASSADSKHFASEPIEVFNANVIGTNNIISLMRSSPCRAAVFISSSTVYGHIADDAESITEEYVGTMPWKDISACYPYGKRCGEFLCHAAFQKYNCPIRIVRPGFVYGASSLVDPRVYAEIIRDVAEGKPIIMQSAGLLYRSMIYVTDLVDAIFCVLFRGRDGEAYNVASEHISIRDFAEAAVKAADNKQVQLRFIHSEDGQARPPARVKGNMSCVKLRKECHWVPRVCAEKGIADSAEIMRKMILKNEL